MVYIKGDLYKYIKKELINQGITLKVFVDMFNEKYGHDISVPNFSNKLNRETFKWYEVVEILDTLGKEIIVNDKRE